MVYSVPHNSEFWQQMFDIATLDDWYFYGYEYLDDLAFLLNARTAFCDWEQGLKLIADVGKKFLEMGWSGDGVMQIIWFPPFLGIGPDNTYGCYALHVKQTEDGISWIACPFKIPALESE